MTLRNLKWTAYAILLGGLAAYADDLGFQVNSTCLDGSCPAGALAFSTNASLPIADTISLPNGDTYSITGMLTSSNDASGGVFALTQTFQVIYRGNSSGGASQADTLAMDVFSGFQTTFNTGNFTDAMTGTFSSDIASSSSVQICVSTLCSNAIGPTAPFNLSVSFTQPPASGAFSFDYTAIAVFGAGSPAGSYIAFSYPAVAAPNVLAAVSASAFGEFSTFAPGSWIEIYGTDLAAGTRTWGGEDFNGVNGPITLGGTTVTIGGMPAFVDFVSPTQVNVQVPGGLSASAQPLVVSTAAGDSTPFTVILNDTEPGLLAPSNFKVNGTQYVVAQFADGTYVLPTGAVAGVNSDVAHPGDTIVIYGIGFGAVDPAIPPGQLVQVENTLASDFTISIGGVPATVAYDGLAPNYMGLYQFDVVVPSVPASNAVPLTFTLGGVGGTQTLAIAVGN